MKPSNSNVDHTDSPMLLTADSDAATGDLVATALRYAGFDTETAGDGHHALAVATQRRPDLIVAEICLPGIDGIELCRRLRSHGDDTPVIFLSACSGRSEVLAGFESGADDYLTKPFVLDELVARVRAVLKHTCGHGRRPLVYADLEVDDLRHAVRREGEPVRLTPTEFQLLRYLIVNAEHVLSKDQILDRVWNYDFNGNSHVVETCISSIRRKIDRNRTTPLIHTIRGVGYTLRAENA